MRKKNFARRFSRPFKSIRRYISYFLLMAFVISCCMLLFLNTMSAATGMALSEEEISKAAKLTFLNVLLLTLICTVIDEVRRKHMVDRPIKRIKAAAEKIINGDLSARIQPLNGPLDSCGDFNEIIDCFNRMAKELSSIETLRSDFIANVSHELKTPLAVMQNYGIMLQQPNLSEETRIEYSKAITEASRNLADLITNILKLNKLENQEIYPAAINYDLGEQLCECLLMFEDVWEKKGLEIETDIEEDVTVCADSEMLALVWNNLFSNAIKFTEAGGKISLSLKKDGDFAIVKISDTGCGIDKETGAHIFEKFYQGDASRAAKGNGLGLALVKRVIGIIGADITVESELGKGSTFMVKIGRKSQ